MSTATITREEIRVEVGGWQNLRTVIVEGSRVLMEVARTSNNCHHCPTCRRRVATVEQVLNGSAWVWKWEFLPQGGMWLAIARREGESAIELLRQATGLKIYT